ncbi:hypothetical protein ASE21_15165 [Flavobacterium sp. Root901]|uniref:PorP/SprF family type IX secretion system membrane protein n=1 Tax=Flavobacterium sp. Root901 TaxID=1736605 RepID=UPI00070C4706|nr:type IX secretion system membrane protein PorP/SprF [Flavobacterium sp. Root901]KRD09179.1 hypothetical protein ASE21_15165 [Flavobacterium sp. Root901]
MRTKLFSFVLVFTAIVSYAQQDAQLTQYMYNTIIINPAYAGSRDVLSVCGLYRSQWAGLDGAPKTSTFSINGPINKSSLGIGISFINDRIGPTNENNLSADLSYTVSTSETFKLSFGIKGSVNLFSLDLSKLNPDIQDDPEFQNFNNKFSPNVGAGIYLHSDKAYIGFSVPGFIETNHYNDNDTAIYKDKINYYLIGGYVFTIDPYKTMKFKPAFLLKIVEGAPLQADLSGSFMYLDKFVLGAAYRWGASISSMAGFQINDALYIGYGYDFDTNKLSNYNSGSHEIFLRYEFFKQNRSPVRFF